jgi:DNA (cytosine-5)-methyltransferase 1
MSRTPGNRDLFEGLVVDSFAGGGGASIGIEMALGRPVDVAINHSPDAIAMHAANHPHTRHLRDDIWHVDPLAATQGRPVDLAWFSPDCTHHSRAKGGKPVSARLRGLAWVVCRWARDVRPRIIMLENVVEWASWGPLTSDHRPDVDRLGEYFNLWERHLRKLGYEIEWRELTACDYGAPTSRTRLFLIARCDGMPIVWPEPTHGDGRQPYRGAADIIDWSIPCPSIFLSREEGRKHNCRRPLAEKTMARIAAGTKRYVTGHSDPFTVDGAAYFMAQHNTGMVGHDCRKPVSTIVGKACTQALVRADLDAGIRHTQAKAFITKYYGSNIGHDCREPLHTITSRDRFGLVQVIDQISDIGMRMFSVPELYAAQSFPGGYIYDRGVDGRPLAKSVQLKLVGNSVPPVMAQALVRANYSSTQQREDAA